MMIVARHLLQVITEVLPSAASCCCYKHSSVRSFSNAVALYKNMCTLPRLIATTSYHDPEFQKVSDRRPPFPPLEYWLNTVEYPVQRVVSYAPMHLLIAAEVIKAFICLYPSCISYYICTLCRLRTYVFCNML